MPPVAGEGMGRGPKPEEPHAVSEQLTPAPDEARAASEPASGASVAGRGWASADGQRVVIVMPPDRDRGPRMTLIGKVITGVITCAAALVGIYVAFRPSSPPLDRWVSEANAVCDETHGDVRSKARAVTEELARAQQSLRAGRITAGQLAAVATRAEDYADAERLVLAGLRRAPTPRDGAAEINRVLQDGDDIVGGFDRVAADMRGVDPTDPASVQLLQDGVTTAQHALDAKARWDRRMKQLHVDSCILG